MPYVLHAYTCDYGCTTSKELATALYYHLSIQYTRYLLQYC